MNSFKNNKPVIAIDGTAGSGKGTLAKRISRSIGFDHLDSGLLYRLFAYQIEKQKLSISSLETVELNLNSFIKEIKNQDLRSERITELSSKVAKLAVVRKSLVLFQRNFADNPPGKKGSVIDGRDITSKIVPNAEVKFFVDASLEIRALRRLKQMNLSNEKYSEILKKMNLRDKQDKQRVESPLIRTSDSIVIDTTKITENEVFEIAMTHIKKKIDCI